jgi:hypothetical protein
MNSALRSEAAEFAPCTICNVVLCDDSWCDWCHFWQSLAAHADASTQERVMSSLWAAKHWALLCGVEVF